MIKYNINNYVGTKFIFASFNQNTRKAIHVIAILKPLKMQIFYFILILENIVENIPINCPTIMIGDYNVDMLTNTSQLQNYKTLLINIDSKTLFFLKKKKLFIVHNRTYMD